MPGRQAKHSQESEPSGSRKQGSHSTTSSASPSRATSGSPRGRSPRGRSPRASSKSSSKNSAGSKKKGGRLPKIDVKAQHKGEQHDNWPSIPESELEAESQEFIEFFESGDLDASVVQDLLENYGQYVNIKDKSFGWSPLLFAASHGCAQVLHMLLDARADVHSACHGGNSALHLAARNGHCQVVECLLTRKAAIDSQNDNGWTSLAWCSINGYPEAAARLLEAAAGADIADSLQCTPSMWAARNGHLRIIEVLLDVGFDLHLRDRDGATALDYAQEHVEMRLLLGDAADKNFSLLEASRHNDADGVRHALQTGAHVNARDLDGYSPLMWAVSHGSLGIVEMLAKSGAKQDNAIAGTPSPVSECLLRALGATDRLLLAARAHDTSAAQEALSYGAWVNSKEAVTLKTPLMWAASHSSVDMVHTCLAAQAHLEQRDAFGWTAIHFAACSQDRALVQILVDASVDIMATNYYDETALHIAARSDDCRMVAALIDSGSDTEAHTTEGYTALQVAALCGASDAVRELLAQLADASVQDTYGCSVLAIAVKQGHELVARVLLKPATSKPSKKPGKSRASSSQKGPSGLGTASSKAGSRPTSSTSSLRSKDTSSRPSLVPTQSQHEAEHAVELETHLEVDGFQQPPQGTASSDSTTCSSKKMLKKFGADSQKLERPDSRGSTGSAPSNSSFKKTRRLLDPRDLDCVSASDALRSPHEDTPTSTSRCSGNPDSEIDIVITPKKAAKRDIDNNGSDGTPEKPKKTSSSRLHTMRANRAMALQSKQPQHTKKSGKKSSAVPMDVLLAHKDKDGNTSLSLAVLHHWPDIVQLLLSSKATTDAIDKRGNSALMHAVYHGRRVEMEQLLAAKADVTLKNTLGQNAINIARDTVMRERLKRHHIAVKFRLATQSSSSLLVDAQMSCSISPSPFRLRLECLPDTLPADIVENHVSRFVRRCGVASPQISVPVLPITMEPRGIAYVEFQNIVEANRVLRRTGSSICGSPICIFKEFAD